MEHENYLYKKMTGAGRLREPPRTTFIFPWAAKNFSLPSREIFPALRAPPRWTMKNKIFGKIWTSIWVSIK